MLRLPSQTTDTEWNSNWKEIQPALRKVRRSMASLRTSSLKVMRVSQLDSDILDIELVDILKEQLWSALSLFKVYTGFNSAVTIHGLTLPLPSLSLSLCVFSQPSKRILNQSYWPFSTSSCLNYPSMIPLLRMALNCKT